MEPKPAQTEVAVVGGGLAGLTAACFLARGGAEGDHFREGADHGRPRRNQRVRGLPLCRPRHTRLLHPGGAASRAFEELGITYGHGTPKRRSCWTAKSCAPSQPAPRNSCAPTCSARGTSWGSSASSPGWAGPDRRIWPGRACKGGWPRTSGARACGGC